MNQSKPLVSIGIPTFNRGALLKRAIESALNQDYQHIEIIVSDNASTDQTESICQSFCAKETRFRYIRHPYNLGPTENFSGVCKEAKGEYFMWLGDDDWIDENYVSACVERLIVDCTISLVSGAPQYYRNGLKSFSGKQFNLLSDSWWNRIISYYAKVADNGMFYGIMRTSQINKIAIRKVMGSDWIMMATIISTGKVMMIPTVSVHRELGGATTSYVHIANSLGLSIFQARLPMLFIASSAWLDIVINTTAYKSQSIIMRLMVASIVFVVIHFNQVLKYWRAAQRISKNFIKKLLFRKS